MATNDRDDEGSTDQEEPPLDPPQGATDERVRSAVEEQDAPGRDDGPLDATQDGTLLVIHDGDGLEDAGGEWISTDTETVDPALLEVRQ